MTIPRLTLALLLLPAGSALAQMPATIRDLRRDAVLEQQVRERMASQTWYLQSRARYKLALARKAVITRLAEAPDASGAYTIAWEEVTRQFSFLTGPQGDLLSFYVLADLASILESDQDSRDHLANLDEEKAQKLRLFMDRESQFLMVLSNLLKKTADTNQQLTQNIK